jgi:hypothetical protein
MAKIYFLLIGTFILTNIAFAFEDGKVFKIYTCDAIRLDIGYTVIARDEGVRLDVVEHVYENDTGKHLIRYFGKVNLPKTQSKIQIGVPIDEYAKKIRYNDPYLDSISIVTEGKYVNEVIGVDQLPNRIILKGDIVYGSPQGFIRVDCQ